MVLKKTLAGIITGSLITLGASSVFANHNIPTYIGCEKKNELYINCQEQTPEERREQLKDDLKELYNKVQNVEWGSIEFSLYGKDGVNASYIASIKPKIFPSYLRLNMGHIEKPVLDGLPNDTFKDSNFIGIDLFASSYTPFLPQSVFNEVGIGLSYWDNPTLSLVTNAEFHLFYEIGFRNRDGFFAAFGFDHWSNAGIVRDRKIIINGKEMKITNLGENIVSAYIGTFY